LSRDRSQAALAAYRGGRSSLNEVLAARRGEFETRLQSLQLELDVARLWARLNFLIPEDDSSSAHLHASQAPR
jgi:outer membrane protein TolC